MYQEPVQARDHSHEMPSMKFSDYEFWCQQNAYATCAQQRCAVSNAATTDFNDQPCSWYYPYLANHQEELARSAPCPVNYVANAQFGVPTAAESSCHTRVYANEDNTKPPYSYAALICMAIGSAPEKRATMREILNYIEENFSYYRSHKRWHGTIRHDLTVNDCFVKLSARPKQKGCLWSVAPDYQDMFANGSLRRRRYRFKEGSAKWLKARAENASKIRRKTAKPTGQKTNNCGSTCPEQMPIPLMNYPEQAATAPQRSSPLPQVVPNDLLTSTETVIPLSDFACPQPTNTTCNHFTPLIQCKSEPRLIFPGVKDSLSENDEDVLLVFPNSVSPFLTSSGYNSAESSSEFSHQYATY